MTYDQRCYDLSITFLEDENLTPKQMAAWAHRMAQDIQTIIEQALEDVRSNDAERAAS